LSLSYSKYSGKKEMMEDKKPFGCDEVAVTPVLLVRLVV
jgi:hypothetical protein